MEEITTMELVIHGDGCEVESAAAVRTWLPQLMAPPGSSKVDGAT